MKSRNLPWLRIAIMGLVFVLVAAACGDDDEPQAATPAPTTEPATAPTTEPMAEPTTEPMAEPTTEPTPAPTTEPTMAPPALPSGTVSFFAFEDSFLPAVFDPLRAAYPDLDIQTSSFSSEDESETKLRAGFEADVVNTCAGPVESKVKAGLLQPIDTSRIEDWDRVFPVFRDAPGVVIDGEVYMVPQFGGSTGIIYDSEAWPGGTASYADLFNNPDVPGSVAIGDAVIVTFAIAAMAAGIEDPYGVEMTQEQIDMVKDFLIEKKGDRIRTIFEGDSDLVSLLQGGEVVAAAPGYPGVTNILNEAGAEGRYKWVGADEASFVWVCGQSIAADAKNIDGAYAVINWYFRPETALEFATRYQFFGGNSRILDISTQEQIETLFLDGPEQIFGSSMIAIQPSNFDAWLDAWREFLAS
jgi:spermidine/putrescine transport system substrate-binding protein